VAIAARCNRSGPRFPFHDSVVEKWQRRSSRTIGLLAFVVNRQGDESSVVRTSNDASFVTALLQRERNRSRKDGHDARARNVSAASACVCARSYASISRRDDEQQRCVHFPEDGVQVWDTPRGTWVRTRRGVSDPVRSGRRVRYALQGGGRSRPGTDVDRRRGIRGGTERRRHLDDRVPACSCYEMGCAYSFRELPTRLRFESRARQRSERGPIEV
jgi:hypothetical protein